MNRLARSAVAGSKPIVPVIAVPLVTALLATVSVATVLLAGCAATAGAHSGASNSSAPAGSSVGASAAPSPTDEVMGDAILADGRYPVIVKALVGSSVTFDLVTFYIGDAAKVEWRRRHPGQAAVEPAFAGYLVVNDNTRLRSLPLAGDATATVISPGGSDPVSIDIASLAGPYVNRIFWLTVLNATITAIDEQHLP